MERKVTQSGDDKIWVTVAHTIPLADYENIKIEVGMERTLAPKERPLTSITNLFDELEELVYDKSAEVKRKYLHKKKKRFDEASESDTY